VNVRGIADSTGLSRETARRKVAELVALGWITRIGGSLHFTPEGYRALAAGRAALEALALRCHGLVEAGRKGQASA
jgi:DNA-binding IclR family transcriptional regulator